MSASPNHTQFRVLAPTTQVVHPTFQFGYQYPPYNGAVGAIPAQISPPMYVQQPQVYLQPVQMIPNTLQAPMQPSRTPPQTTTHTQQHAPQDTSPQPSQNNTNTHQALQERLQQLATLLEQTHHQAVVARAETQWYRHRYTHICTQLGLSEEEQHTTLPMDLRDRFAARRVVQTDALDVKMQQHTHHNINSIAQRGGVIGADSSLPVGNYDVIHEERINDPTTANVDVIGEPAKSKSLFKVRTSGVSSKEYSEEHAGGVSAPKVPTPAPISTDSATQLNTTDSVDSTEVHNEREALNRIRGPSIDSPMVYSDQESVGKHSNAHEDLSGSCDRYHLVVDKPSEAGVQSDTYAPKHTQIHNNTYVPRHTPPPPQKLEVDVDERDELEDSPYQTAKHESDSESSEDECSAGKPDEDAVTDESKQRCCALQGDSEEFSGEDASWGDKMSVRVCGVVPVWSVVTLIILMGVSLLSILHIAQCEIDHSMWPAAVQTWANRIAGLRCPLELSSDHQQLAKSSHDSEWIALAFRVHEFLVWGFGVLCAVVWFG